MTLLLVLAVGVALARGRARNLPQHICAQRLPGAQLAGALRRLGDRAQRGAGGDRGTRGLSNTTVRRLPGG